MSGDSIRLGSRVNPTAMMAYAADDHEARDQAHEQARPRVAGSRPHSRRGLGGHALRLGDRGPTRLPDQTRREGRQTTDGDE